MNATLRLADLRTRAARLGLELLQAGNVWRLNFAAFGDAGGLGWCRTLDEAELALRDFEAARAVCAGLIERLRA